MDIQWYPGHMTKARRSMEKDVRLVDLIIELRDARAPYSTENPDLARLAKGKKRLILLNKADLADTAVTRLWIEAYKKSGLEAIALDSRNRDFLGSFRSAVSRLAEEKRERDRNRGIAEERPLKAMICGIPNIGKSTFINSVLGRSSARTGNKPGVTKGNQWLTLSREFMLLDTPGVLWPRFESQAVGVNLALLGSINDDILNKEELCMKLIVILLDNYPKALSEHYGIASGDIEEREESYDLLPIGVDKRALAYMDVIALKRGCIKKGAEPDYERCSRLIIDDLRGGRLGRISLERP